LPRSASDSDQTIYSTMRSESIKSKTDRDHEPNSLATDNLCHCMPCQPPHNCVGLSECQLSLLPTALTTVHSRIPYCLYKHSTGRGRWGLTSQLQQQLALWVCLKCMQAATNC